MDAAAVSGRLGLVEGDCDPRINTCIVLEEVDADDEFNRRMIRFTSEAGTPFVGWGECVGPKGFCLTPRLGTEIDFLCDHKNTSTTDVANVHWACDGGRYCGRTEGAELDVSLEAAQCRDPEFLCPVESRLRWGEEIPARCSNAWTNYEIIAEVVNPAPSPFPGADGPQLARTYCSHSVRHGPRAAQNGGTAQEGCGYYPPGPEGTADPRCDTRPAGDHCGPAGPESYGCLPGATAGMAGATPGCPHDPADWPDGLGSENFEAFVARAEVRVGRRCAAMGCGSVAVCRPASGLNQEVDPDTGERVGPGIMLSQNGSPYKNDSFIGHARVCRGPGPDACNDPERVAPDGQCLPEYTDDTRDAVVAGPVSWAEIDVSCHCADPPAGAR